MITKFILRSLFVLICTVFLQGFRNNVSLFKDLKSEKIDSIKINNLVIFSKVFGDIRFFYPNSAIKNEYWNELLCKTIRDLLDQPYSINLQQLNNIFAKAAPKCKFYRNYSQDNRFNKISCNEVLHWFHKGIGLEEEDVNIYESKILSTKVTETLKDSIYYTTEASDHIYLKFPLYVCKTDNQKFAYDKKDEYSDKVYSLANAIYIWNLIKHFFPYRNEIPVNFEFSLREVISTILSDKNNDTSKKAIDKMVASINDGHANYVTQDNMGDKYYLPEDIIVIDSNYYYFKNDKLDSTKVVGGRVLKVNGLSIDSLFFEEKKAISGSEQFKRELFAKNLLAGDSSKSCELQIRAGDTLISEITIPYSLSAEQYVVDRLHKQKKSFETIKENIMYINMQSVTYKEFLENFEKINLSSGLIFDLRGYPNPDGETEKILCHLLKQDDTSKWMKIPLIEYPNFSNVNFKNIGWGLKKSDLQIKTQNIVFLINSKTYSYAESIISYVKDYKLGVLIGDKTAGANGDIIFFPLLNNSIFMFTGLKVNGPMGSSYFKEGILPDIKKLPTPSSLIDGEDYLVEYATEYLSNTTL